MMSSFYWEKALCHCVSSAPHFATTWWCHNLEVETKTLSQNVSPDYPVMPSHCPEEWRPQNSLVLLLFRLDSFCRVVVETNI